MKQRILVVDDSDDVLNILEYAFEHAGFACDAAHNMIELQAALASSMPDLILLDLMLPETNGYQIIEWLHGDPRTCAIPIIVITAKAEALYRQISADLGVQGHITKPFHLQEVVSHARAMLQSADTASGSPIARP
jgi:DNA-binding response OmpR family regulator